ncbi:DUF4145 domain-containing protein [Neobacillus sp. SCS-31]|uniref:DUF4145 domain-containing protein n=1 Tax=Neobacillus oceani TaxID=3115292 RepID=UPI003905CFF1
MEKFDEKIYCRVCRKKTFNNIVYEIREEVTIKGSMGGFLVKHSVVECGGCRTITYADIIYALEFDGENWVISDLPQHINVFPEEPKAAVSKNVKMDIQYSMTVPDNIKEIYIELISSYNMGHNLLCAIGIRTLIEAICNELNISKGFKHDNEGNPLTKEGKKESIEGKIYGLFENKHIVWNQCLILQRIREIGNAATHQLITPTSEEIYYAIDIVEGVIENIYNLKNHKLLRS